MKRLEEITGNIAMICLMALPVFVIIAIWFDVPNDMIIKVAATDTVLLFSSAIVFRIISEHTENE